MFAKHIILNFKQYFAYYLVYFKIYYKKSIIFRFPSVQLFLIENNLNLTKIIKII